MIVDDSRAQLKLLEQWIGDLGFTARGFLDGHEALKAVEEESPDLILLDVNMPKMDGFELCRRIKLNEHLADIPIIFISASGDTSAKIEAFRSGGVDYVTKPFRLEEVRARVETHLQLSRLQRELEEHNRSLEDLVRERTAELGEAHARLEILDKAKSEFLRLISHELRTPLNGVLGITDIILNDVSADLKAAKLGNAYREARHNLLAIVDDALLLTQINISNAQRQLQPVRMSDLIEEVHLTAQDFAEARSVALVPPEPSNVVIRANRELLVRAFTGLVETAIKLCTKGEAVRWSMNSTLHGSSISIEARGRIIPETALLRFFDTFSIVDPIVPGGDLGLRHIVAERIIALNRASINVTNLEPSGVRFDIHFPLDERTESE